MIDDYIKSVYAGVLGKVIGVYMGRPFEGWTKQRLEEKWGLIDHYVNDDVNKPLVVADDDITGTLTFIRALEDSGLYAKNPTEFFGETWLNYIIENKSILWWGGMGMSTEHTAFLRLKNGIKAPESGSIELNGKAVAEQIGAQIFIDGFGLVCPGRPELAAELAGRAARVSHDGEAVHAAKVVAAMVSAAFNEKDMARLLDVGISVIPSDSLIAEIHRNVRTWSQIDGDWRKTFNRIDAEYGYHKYPGGCHVVPNHAVMVMAWCYAPDNFRQSQAIINTAGWDTDCNAANVGCVMGVKLGLARINENYDFQGPFADRLYLPTAEGTRSVSDVLREALHLIQIGCRIMGWDIPAAPKKGALFHFSQPGAQHGFMPEDQTDTISCRNVLSKMTGERCLEISFHGLPGGYGRISTPCLASETVKGTYDVMGTSILSPGMKIRLEGSVAEVCEPINIKAFLRHGDSNSELKYSDIISQNRQGDFFIELTIPDPGQPVRDLGLEIGGAEKASGRILLDAVRLSGQPQMTITASKLLENHDFPGWIKNFDAMRSGFKSDVESTLYLIKNSGKGTMVTGTNRWQDYVFDAQVKIHMADGGGILVRHQGQRRYIALILRKDRIQLVKEYYATSVLIEQKVDLPPGKTVNLSLQCIGPDIAALLDGKQIGQVKIPELVCGGAGFIFENGCFGITTARVGGIIS